MAFCSKCGASIDDGAAFCQFCGSQVASSQPVADVNPQPQPQPQPQPVYAPQPAARVAPATPAIGVLKKIASSPLFIVSVVAFSLSILFSIIQALTAFSVVERIFDMLYRFAYYTDLYDLIYALDELSAVLNNIPLTAIGGTSAILGMTPQIITAIGLWLIFASAVKKNSANMQTGGFTMIKVINIINLVLVCISFGVAVLIWLVTTVVAISAEAPVEVVIILVIADAIFAIAAVLNILCYAKINKSLKSASSVITTGKVSTYASRYVGVICWIAAVAGLFPGLVSLSTSGALANICSCVASACFGALVFTYRNKMQGLEMAQANAPYSFQPAEAPATPDLSNTVS